MFIKNEQALETVEYAVMLALIVVMLLGTLVSLGTAMNGQISAVDRIVRIR